MRKTAWILGALAVAVLLAVSPALSHDGGKRGHHMMFDGERIDLSELADGEIRTFGEGEHQITAERKGELITIAVGDTEMVHDLMCDTAEDSCFVILSGDDDRMKLWVTKGGEDGGHMEEQVMVMALGEHGHGSGHEMFFSSSEDGEFMDVTVAASGDGARWVSEDDGGVQVFVTSAGEGDPHGNRLLLRSAGMTLRCPEGDTTMRLEEGEEDAGPYYCPKHDLKLEKVDVRKKVHRIHVQADDD